MRSRLLTLLFLAIAIAALLTAGALQVRQRFLTRGLPAHLPEPIPHAGVQIGLNVSLLASDDGEQADALNRISDLGITYVKQTFAFSSDFDWPASEGLITAVSDHNLILIPLLDGNPADDFAPPADPNRFAAWAGEFAARYGDQIPAYIIWDEPNLSSHWGGMPVNASEYAALLTATSHAIRSADPDAVIVAAPLAPTGETGPTNLAEPLYLQQLLEAGAAGAFDVVAAKPYGFDTGPEDRRVALDVLNFSRTILLREVLARNGEGATAVWAGNWGWNSLPPDWQGAPSIWGAAPEAQRAEGTVEALERARREWPWMGLMFLENWEPDAPPDDPRWGFSIADTETAVALQKYLADIDPGVAYPGFHLAHPDAPAQQFDGGWRFSPTFGADISRPTPGAPPDSLTFTFWGTDVGVRVRRADFRARLYVTVDGQPANALPRDETGAALVLTSPDPSDDFITIEPVARNLSPGQHTLQITTSRGWDQWALNGFSVRYWPPNAGFRIAVGASLLAALLFTALGVWQARRAEWGTAGARLRQAYGGLSDSMQLALTAAAASLAALGGWLTWGEQAAGLYRRLGDGGQLALTAAAASIFYVSPVFILTAIALAALLLLIYLRPAWGLALVALSFPLYVQPVLKPIFSYRFSPVEIFLLVTVVATAAHWLRHRRWTTRRPTWRLPDTAVLVFVGVATLSLLFTERLDVATNEWRLVIVEPALFYLLLRLLPPTRREMWVILDAFVLSGVIVALVGLGEYVAGVDPITAEGGLIRLRSIYGSPNNVALYLVRIVPLLVAMLLLGQATLPSRRWAYTAALLPLSTALLLTFSRGGLLLGLPAGLLVVFWIWQRRNGRSPWPWIIVGGVAGVAVFLLAQQIPQLSERLNLTGATGVFRLNLWRASLEMVREHPLLGVGLDNFLYAYRGRYILEAAWQEPNLNHPHNILLDFATRLGLLGLLAGGWLLWEALRTLKQALPTATPAWLPVAVGFSGTLAAMLAHGLVDHSFFLVDLAFVFYLLLGTAVWLTGRQATQS